MRSPSLPKEEGGLVPFLSEKARERLSNKSLSITLILSENPFARALSAADFTAMGLTSQAVQIAPFDAANMLRIPEP
ncbi:MAG TPA: hypothetical protein VI387_07335, partial [Candidatus Brocadiales bacterium]|nr:hypothetical protein [Candidatus Brocadiales bacterium]